MAEINYQNSKFKKSPVYSFSKQNKFSYKKNYIDWYPGPSSYSPNFQAVFQKSPKITISGRHNHFRSTNENPGPGMYNLKSFTDEKKGFRFGHKKKFNDEENFMENLFLPVNYS